MPLTADFFFLATFDLLSPSSALLLTERATVKGKSSSSWIGSFLISIKGIEGLRRFLSPEATFLLGDLNLLSSFDNLAAIRSFLRCSSVGGGGGG